VLTGLRLENIALIERLELAFGPGFTVLTGETGAGKSILLDALDALLGGAQGAQGARLLRRGCERGRIEASFALSPPVAAWLAEQELEAEEGELLLSRDWRLQEGKSLSRHRLNGVAIGRSQVMELRPGPDPAAGPPRPAAPLAGPLRRIRSRLAPRGGGGRLAGLEGGRGGVGRRPRRSGPAGAGAPAPGAAARGS